MTEHPNICAALVAALADLTVVDKGRTVNTGTYSYDYAEISDVVKKTRPALAENGLVALTPIHDHGNGLACTVTFLHTSGERLDFGPFPFPHGRDAQATGSMVTYHRRYALVAALGMAAGDDDDGAAAVPRSKEQDQVVTVPADLSNIDSLTRPQLVMALSEANLPTAGKEDVLRARLAEHLAAKDGTEPFEPAAQVIDNANGGNVAAEMEARAREVARKAREKAATA